MVREVIDAFLAALGVLQPDVESAFHDVMVGVREYCFVKNTFLNVLEDGHELETGSASSTNVNLILADHPDSPCSMRAQTSSAHDDFSEENNENSVRFMRSVMAPGADGHNLCPHLLLFH